VRRSRESRVIAAVLRCYPARWRFRHGDEAAALATSLLEDGTPWWSIAGSFLNGAAKERVCRKPRLRIGPAMAALILVLAAAPVALLASLTPASASGTYVTIVISKPGDAARQLETAFADHHFKFAVVERSVVTDVVGSILSIRTGHAANDNAGAIREVDGQCNDGHPGCVVGLVIPLHYSGSVRVTVGAPATPMEVHRPNIAQRSLVR
jgi:hypothetical protein